MTKKQIKPNPTHAKDVALHFLNLTTDRLTPTIVSRTVKQVKDVMAQGYTKEELIEVVDYILDKKAGVYSFGYISASINDALRQINEAKLKVQLKSVQEDVASAIEQQRAEVVVDDKSSERNRNKAKQLGVQSRFGKKYNFDMFEGK